MGSRSKFYVQGYQKGQGFDTECVTKMVTTSETFICNVDRITTKEKEEIYFDRHLRRHR